MVEHVFGKTRMLGMAVDELEPTAVKGRQPDVHQRKDAARVDRKADDARVDEEVDAGPEDHFAILRFRNEGLFLRSEPAGAMEEDAAEEGMRLVLMPKNLKNRVNQFGGRVTAISGSRPTIIVSLWWRAWLQRQRVDSRRTMKEAIS